MGNTGVALTASHKFIMGTGDTCVALQPNLDLHPAAAPLKGLLMRRKPQVQLRALYRAATILNSSISVTWNIDHCLEGQQSSVSGNRAMARSCSTRGYSDLLGLTLVDSIAVDRVAKS